MTKMMTKYQIPSFALSRICKLNSQVSYLISDYIIWNRKINDDDNKTWSSQQKMGRQFEMFSATGRKKRMCTASPQVNKTYLSCVCVTLYLLKGSARRSRSGAVHIRFFPAVAENVLKSSSHLLLRWPLLHFSCRQRQGSQLSGNQGGDSIWTKRLPK